MRKVNSRPFWGGWLLCLASYGCSQSQGLHMQNEQPSYSGNQTTNQQLAIGQGASTGGASDKVKYVPVSEHIAIQIKEVIEKAKKTLKKEESKKDISDLFADGGEVDVLAKSANGRTLLHLAIEYGHTGQGLAEWLIENGANIKASTSGGMIPLHLAAKIGALTICQLLIGGGADVTSPTKQGTTPLDLATDKGYPIPVDIPIVNNTNVQERDAMPSQEASHSPSPNSLMQESELPASTSTEDMQFPSSSGQMQEQELLGSTLTEDRQFPFPDNSRHGLEPLASVTASAPQRQIKRELVEQYEDNQEEAAIKKKRRRDTELEKQKQNIDYRKELIQELRQRPLKNEKERNELLQQYETLIKELQNRRDRLEKLPGIDPVLIDTAGTDIVEAMKDRQRTADQSLDVELITINDGDE